MVVGGSPARLAAAAEARQRGPRADEEVHAQLRPAPRRAQHLRRVRALACEGAIVHARQSVGIRLALSATKRLFWHCGDHCQARIGDMSPIPYYQNLLFSVARFGRIPGPLSSGHGPQTEELFFVFEKCSFKKCSRPQ